MTKHEAQPKQEAISVPDGWRPIAEADKDIAYIHVLDAADMRIGGSYPIWARDADGRVYEALWSDDGKRAYWWDIEGESPVDPVEFMPHPLDPRYAAPTPSAPSVPVVCETCNGTGKEGRHQICRDCDDTPPSPAVPVKPEPVKPVLTADLLEQETRRETGILMLMSERYAAQSVRKFASRLLDEFTLASPPSDDVEQLRAENARLQGQCEAEAIYSDGLRHRAETAEAALTAAGARERVLVEAAEDLVKAHRRARVELGYDEDGESDSIEFAEEAIAASRAALEQVKPKETTHEG